MYQTVSSKDNISNNSTKVVAAAVMKEDEDSREELDLYQKEIDEISSIYTLILKEECLNLIAAAADLYDNDLAITNPEAILKEGYGK